MEEKDQIQIFHWKNQCILPDWSVSLIIYNVPDSCISPFFSFSAFLFIYLNIVLITLQDVTGVSLSLWHTINLLLMCQGPLVESFILIYISHVSTKPA